MTHFRWNFIQNFTLKTLNLKNDKWSKMVGLDDQKNLIQDWLDKRNLLVLIFYLTPAGVLIADQDSPPSSKTKVIQVPLGQS